MAIDKLNKTFVRGAVLKADELNEMVSKTNEIIDGLDEKIGATYFDVTTMRQLQFRSVDDRDAWLNGGGDSLILRADQFSFSGTINQVKVTDEYGTKNLYFTTTSERADITVGFISQTKGIADSSWTEVYEDFIVTVGVDKGSTGNYTYIITDKIVKNGDTFTFDVKKYLASGNNRVRITAVGSETGEIGTSIYTANLTSMYISPSNFAWYKPFIEGEDFSLGGMNIGGNLSKKVIVKVTNDTLGYSSTYEDNIGSATYITSAYFFRKMTFPTTGTGTYQVEIWLDANGLESEHLFYNIMCITSEEQFTASEICINDVSKATNGVDSTLFSFSVYNKGQATASPTFKIEKDGEMVQEETLQSIATSALQKYSASLEFEDERTSFDINITGILEDARQYVTVNVDNSASFPSVSGATFYLNPAKRNNAQDNKEVIINEMNGGIHNVTWTNMAWVDGTDGWTTDNDGRKCLLIPATCKGVVNYQPLATQGSGKTIEIVYKVSNAADYGENIITSALNPTASNFQGIVIKPKKVMVHSRDLYVNDDAQSYPTKDEEMVHLVITIVKNYKTNYGNICIIYVNGVKKCSFEFTNTDSFANSASLYLGSETADLYIYKMRVYESGFGWQDAVQNYINCLPTQADKIVAWTKINAILDDSYKVDYDAVYGKYNTMVIEMKGNGVIPNLLQPAGGYCDLWINIINPKEGELDEDFASLFNGSLIEEQQIEGQGTTAMTYYRWNFRWKLTSAYNKRRITAKKNVASSMQDHKMGATRMFNDLHNSIVGENEANARVAVFQYPVYGFERTLVEGTEDEYVYTFIGLYTIGPDKGDKATFGYNDERFETTVMHLEGTDHTPTSVGMEYPWNETRYDASREAMGAILGNSIDAAWEVGAAGELESDSASDQDGVQAMLDTEFKPAYEVAYFNSTFIEGASESLEEINANIDTWRANKNANGVSYSTLEFWTDGVYDLYYYNVSEKIYKPTGVNMLTDLGLSSGDVSGKTIAEKNELFKQKRRERFASEMGNYWHKDDCVFHYTFCMMFAATDNFKKNSYPYKFSSLADGGRWCWRQDDLDTLFDINNQGFSAKLYSVLVGDQTSTGSGSVYRGDNSVFWTLIKECFKEEIKAMVHRIMDKMAELSPYGQNNLERIVGYVRSCCWDMAQDYFAKSGYNEDAEWTYEEAWYLRNQGKYNNDVHPLQQSLGSHYEAERDWVELRMVFLASYFQYGAFATDHGDDTSTGQISFRSTSGKTYTITPALDFNPTILIGQSALVSAEDRIKAGQSVDVVVPDMGSNDTHIYIQGADYYSDLGNLADISTSADNPVLNVSSKRLRRLKVGDELASNVTSNVKTLTVGACPSMESVDARNLKSLVGAVDLTKCPRLKEALFGGTSATSISIPVGSKIVKLSLPDTLTTLSLVRLLNLTEENLSYGTMANLAYVRIESNDKMDGFEVLKTAYENSPELKNIRIVGFEYVGDGSDITMIADLATAVDENGNRIYSGIDDEGNITTGLPVLDGSLSIDTPAYESDVQVINTYYPALAISVPEFYIPFVDDVVKQLCATNFGDGIGLTPSEAATITSIGSVFTSNTEIEAFNELELFTGIKTINSTAFKNCSNLKSVKLSNHVTTIDGDAFSYSGIETIQLPESIKVLKYGAFQYCANLVINTLHLPNLTSDCKAAVFRTGAQIRKVTSLGSTTTLQEWFSGNKLLESCVIPETVETIAGAFSGCSNLTNVNLPKRITTAGGAFRLCTNLSIEIDLPNLTGTLGSFFASESGITKVISLGNITTMKDNCFYNCQNLESMVLPNTLEVVEHRGIHTCPNLVFDFANLPKSLKRIISFFTDCKKAFGEVSLPNLESIGSNIFAGTLVTKVLDLGKITVVNGYFCDQLHNTEKTLTEVHLPATVTRIDGGFCRAATGLKIVVVNSVTPPSLYTTAFQHTTVGAFNIYVPNESIHDYQAATTWINYKDYLFPMEVYEYGYIDFADEEVKRICLENWDTNGTGFLTPPEAQAVTSLGTVFQGNTTITSFDELEEFTGMTSIPNNAFRDCTNLVSVKLHDGVLVIGYDLFNGCTSLASVNLPKSITHIYSAAFHGTLAEIEVDLPNLTTLSRVAFGSSGITKVKSLGTITTIYDRTFLNCKKLKSVVLHEGIIKIQEAAFEGCSALSEINLPQSITSIGSSVFARVPAPMVVDLPNLTSLGTYAFKGSGVVSVINLGGITNIPDQCFNQCTSLKEIHLKPIIDTINSQSFEGTDFETFEWTQENIRVVGYNAFYNCPLQTDLNLPNLESIGAGSFNLTQITNVYDLGKITVLENAFNSCASLKYVKLPSTIQTIKNWALGRCYILETVIIDIPTPPVVEIYAFEASGKCIIYVPDESVEDYKAATNWNKWASRIKGISELPTT